MMDVWATRGPLALALLPLSALYAALAGLNRWTYQSGLRTVYRSHLPIVIVGNLSVGGTGKSPLTAWLCNQLLAHGVRPGIVSRGYGGRVRDQAHRVQTTDSADLVGDEPLMLARLTQVPVCVCRKRARAIALLEQSGEVDVILSDDGLQHHAMARDVEIVVVDKARGFGNGFRLPAGPMRESPQRVSVVDYLIYQRQPGTAEVPDEPSFVLDVTTVRNVSTGKESDLSEYKGRPVHAVAGIGRPARFFDALRQHGLDVIEHPLPDHHPLQPSDVCFDNTHPVFVTSKDAVKLDAKDARLHHVHEVPAVLHASTGLQRLVNKLLEDLARHEFDKDD